MQLAEKLAHLKSENPIIYALPRGGVPVAFEVKIFPFKQLEQD
jgi:predicted phosphoribosyltransferase